MQQIVEPEINTALTAVLLAFAGRKAGASLQQELLARSGGDGVLLGEAGHWVDRGQWLELLRGAEELLEHPQAVGGLGAEWLRHPAGALLERICLPYDRPEMAFAGLPAIMASFYRAGRFQTFRLEPGRAHIAFLPFDREGDLLEGLALAGLYTAIARLTGAPAATGRYAGGAGHKRVVEVVWEPVPVPRRVLWTGGAVGAVAGTVAAVLAGAGPVWGGLLAGVSMAAGALGGRQFGLQGVWRSRMGRILAEKERAASELERKEQEIRLAQRRLTGLLELESPIASLTDPGMLGQEITETAIHWLGADVVAFWQRQESGMRLTGLSGAQELPPGWTNPGGDGSWMLPGEGVGAWPTEGSEAESFRGGESYGADLMLPIGGEQVLGVLVAFYRSDSLPPLGKVIVQRLGREIRLLLEMQEEERVIRQEKERAERLAALGRSLLEATGEEEIRDLLEDAGSDLLAPCQAALGDAREKETDGEDTDSEGTAIPQHFFPLGEEGALGLLEVSGPMTPREEEMAASLAGMAGVAMAKLRRLRELETSHRQVATLEEQERLLVGSLSSKAVREQAARLVGRRWNGATVAYREGHPTELVALARLRDGQAIGQRSSGETVPLSDGPFPLRDGGFRSLVFPVRPGGFLQGSLIVEPGEDGWPEEVTLREAGLLMGQVAQALSAALRFERMQAMADRDPLTGLYNEREFRIRLEAELSRCTRQGGTLSLILVEIDRPSRPVGRHGQTMERALLAVGETMGRIGRRGDVAARAGERRFALLLPGTEPQQARFLARRLLEEVFGQSRSAVPLRLGLAAFPVDAGDGESLLKLAEQALHLAEQPDQDRVQGIEELLAQFSSPERLQQLAQGASRDSLDVLALIADARDPFDRGHGRRVSQLATSLAESFGLNGAALERVRMAGLLHDIGKLAVPWDILRKEGPLTEEEVAFLQSHAARGAELLDPFPFLEEEREIIRHHHEHFDGSGYPGSLKGREIPLGSRILAVVDSYDAMVHRLAGGRRFSPQEAEEELLRYRGSHYDAAVVDRFLEMLRTQSARSRADSSRSLA